MTRKHPLEHEQPEFVRYLPKVEYEELRPMVDRVLGFDRFGPGLRIAMPEDEEAA